MKIGVNCVHWDARNDLRELTTALGCLSEVVLFSSGDLDPIPSGIEVRRAPAVRSRDKMLFRIWSLVGELPRWKQALAAPVISGNRVASEVKVRRALRILGMRAALPWSVRRDWLFSGLGKQTAEPGVGDIDAFLMLTSMDREAAGLKYWAAALATGKPIVLYVSSWDHSSNARFRWAGFDRYCVWSRGMARDIWEDHGVALSACREVGATLLGALEHYVRDRAERAMDKPYVLFACALGNESLARRELALAAELAEMLSHLRPSWKLVVRAYPMAKLVPLYDNLAQRENVLLDSKFLEKHSDRRLSEPEIREKYQWLDHCELFVHVGTTLGLECAYLRRPQVLWVDDLERQSGGIANIGRNPHIVRYLRSGRWPEEVHSVAELGEVIQRLEELRPCLQEYNRRLREISPLRDVSSIAGDLVGHVKSVCLERKMTPA